MPIVKFIFCCRFIVPILAGLFGVSSTWAQATNAVHALSLRTALEAAVQQHPQILKALGLAAAAEQDKQAADWNRYPTLTAEARGESGSRQSILRLEQPVWSGGRIDAGIEAAQLSQQAAEQSKIEIQQNMLEQTANSFYDVFRWQARLKLAQDNFEEHRRLFDLIARRADAEISPVSDTLLAQARLQQAQSEKLLAAKQLKLASHNLSQWIGQDFAVLKEPATWPDRQHLNVLALMDQALQFSPTRRKLKIQAEREAAVARQINASLKPTVVAGYQYTLGDLLPGTVDRAKAYVGMSFQPGAGLSALNNLNAALIRQQAAEQDILAQERQLRQQVESLTQELQSLSAQRVPLLSLADQTEKVIESYVRQYQIGRKNWLDVLNAQREKVQARANALDTLWAIEQAHLRLMVTIGELTPDTMSLLND
jgi:adhesin transport system outer membrane protein